MRISLDSNIFAYVLSGIPQWRNPAVAILKMVERGEVVGVASTVCLTEVLAGYSFGSDEGEDAQLFMEGLQGIDYFPVDLEIAIRAGYFRAKFGSKLKTPDSIHIATALVQSSNILITNDQYLAGLQIDGLKIQLLKEFTLPRV